MMKKYTSLIRKLVDATAEAESRGDDVADILKERCFNDTDIVRQTIMNAVCDPRFKLYADVVGYWKDEARKALRQLADQLENTHTLTEENANNMLDSFLSAWFKMSYTGAKKAVKIKPNYFSPEDKSIGDVRDALGFLDGLEMDIVPPQVARTAQKGDKAKAAGKSKPEDPKPNDPIQVDEQSQRATDGQGRRPTNSTNLQKLEERFLKRLPYSLVELARRIGRMGESGINKEGKFLRAGKSDIAGITVGNDISAVLPSELALLAHPQTQNVFYNNYTTRRLQLFASASQTKAPNKHQDGPVIICVDTSSSMIGEPVMVAKALAVAVAIIAWRRKRNVVLVKYSDTYDYKDFGCNRSNLGELSSFLSGVSMAGNNENGMFQWLFKEVKPNLPTYDTSDILCISDFGWAPLSQTTEKAIEEQKKSGMKFYGLNVNTGNYFSSILDETYSPMDVCDSVWIYENGECKEITR